jgi:hypothetical protein
MQIENPFNNEIIVIKNFLKQEVIDKIISLAESLEEEDWSRLNHEASDDYLDKIYSINGPSSKKVHGLDGDFIAQITNNAKDILFNIYKDEKEKISISDFGILSRTSGRGMGEHHDSGDGDPHETKYGLVLYLNTQNKDFTGGELYYPKLNVTYYPAAGDLVIHPGSEEYSHEVKDVTSGIRYMMSSFAKTILPVF